MSNKFAPSVKQPLRSLLSCGYRGFSYPTHEISYSSRDSSTGYCQVYTRSQGTRHCRKFEAVSWVNDIHLQQSEVTKSSVKDKNV